MFDPSTAVNQPSDIVVDEPADAKQPTIIKGSIDILLIAPHACIRDGEPKDDENTGPITEMVARQIGCSAIINTYFHKPMVKNTVRAINPKSMNTPTD